MRLGDRDDRGSHWQMSIQRQKGIIKKNLLCDGNTVSIYTFRKASVKSAYAINAFSVFISMQKYVEIFFT